MKELRGLLQGRLVVVVIVAFGLGQLLAFLLSYFSLAVIQFFATVGNHGDTTRFDFTIHHTTLSLGETFAGLLALALLLLFTPFAVRLLRRWNDGGQEEDARA